ncbi:MAG: UDP binding domain-containing protein, partial [Candidatus Kariarchaeum pelagius]
GAYRDINIAIANQMAEMADNYDVDILEVIEVANTEPFSNIHTPGMGVGGHCIPVYPKFLIHDSNKIGFNPTLMSESRQINDNMVKYSVDQLVKYQEKIKNILILGLAYRGGVKEFRNSPTLNLLNHIKKLNPNEIKIIDPLYTKDEINSILESDIGYDYDKIEYSTYDTIIVVTDHSEFKEMEKSLLEGKIIYDGRYIFKDLPINNSTVIQPGRGTQSY